MRFGYIALACTVLFCSLSSVAAAGEIVTLTSPAEETAFIGDYSVSMVNFYAEWCRFSQMLMPIYQRTAEILAESGVSAAVAKVNCEASPALAAAHSISKYPTLKVVRNGKFARREYRGERSAKAISEFLINLTKPAFTVVQDTSEFLTQRKPGRRAILATLVNSAMEDNEPAHIFDDVALNHKDDCDFFAVRSAESTDKQTFVGHDGSEITQFTIENDNLAEAMAEFCTPLVREITFENAEALTEEGLPFLILFVSPDDTQSIKTFEQEIRNRLMKDRTRLNFIWGDGSKFTHPLHHLGKRKTDLPVLALDSFRHMYDFGPFADITKGTVLQDFIADFNNGMLHQRFHKAQSGHGHQHGNLRRDQQAGDAAADAPDTPPPASPDANAQPDTPPPSSNNDKPAPVESTFRRLGPSKQRYSLLREEL